jgi:hypothetical protein
METFLAAYIECALWSSNHQDTEIPLDATHGPNSLTRELKMKMAADCEKFLAEAAPYIGESEAEQAGHDFWLTRNGHGAGFWDGDWDTRGDALTEICKKFDEVDLIVGDDGFIHSLN